MKNNCNISSQGSAKDKDAGEEIRSPVENQKGNNPFNTKEGEHYWSSQNNNISLRQENKPAETISGPSSSVGGLS